jgi:hypothetical protein
MFSIFSATADVVALPDIDADFTPMEAAVSARVAEASAGGAGAVEAAAPASAGPRKDSKGSSDWFARVVAPAADAREDDRLFEQFRGQLLEQHGGDAMNRLANIDALALLQVHRARLYRHAEGIWSPILPPEADRAARHAADHLRHQDVLSRLISDCDARRPLSCDPEEVKVVAPLVAALVQEVIDEMAQAEDERAAIEGTLLSLLPMPDVDADEAKLREEVASLAPVREVVLDGNRLRGLLCGEVTLPDAQFELFKKLLESATKMVAERWKSAQAAIATCRQAAANHAAALARDPRRLKQLYATIDTVERNIREQEKQLAKLCAPAVPGPKNRVKQSAGSPSASWVNSPGRSDRLQSWPVSENS